MRYRTHSELTRFTVAAGLALACGVGLAAALPMPATDRLYELVIVAADGNAYVADYGLTLSDCVGRWDGFPPVVGLECNPMGER